MTDLFKQEKIRTGTLLHREVWRTTNLFPVKNLAVILMVALEERLQFLQSLKEPLLINSVPMKEVCSV